MIENLFSYFFLLSQVPICKTFIERGTQKQAKQAVKCLFMNSTATRDEVFQEILDIIKVRMRNEDPLE